MWSIKKICLHNNGAAESVNYGGYCTIRIMQLHEWLWSPWLQLRLMELSFSLSFSLSIYIYIYIYIIDTSINEAELWSSIFDWWSAINTFWHCTILVELRSSVIHLWSTGKIQFMKLHNFIYGYPYGLWSTIIRIIDPHNGIMQLHDSKCAGKS